MSRAEASVGTDAMRGGIIAAVALLIGAFVATRIDPVGLTGDVETSASGEAAAASPAADEGTIDDAGSAEGEGGAEAQAAADGGDGTADAEDPAGAGATTSDPSAAADSGAVAADATTTSSAPEARSPSQVIVLVLNGADAQGIAAQGRSKAEAAGYNVMPAGNATGLQPSAFYYTEGFEQEALALADVYGPELQILVEPLDPADPPGDDIDGAEVIVVLGTDGLIPYS